MPLYLRNPACLPALALALLPALAACTSEEDTIPGEFDVARSAEPHDEAPQLSPADAAQLAADNHALALDLYHALRDGQAAGEGFSVSPYSVQTAFGMLYGGTVEPARTEMADVLHFSLDGETQHVAHNWLDAELARRNLPEEDNPEGSMGPVIVDTANGVWVLDELRERIAADFLDLLALHYDAGLFLADFKGDPEGEREGINRWVSEKTRTLIPELLPSGIIKPSTTMVLVNAFYLKAPWADPFRENLTSNGTFTRHDGSTVEAPMMRNGELGSRYAEGPGYQAVALPMRGGALELVVILPDDLVSFEESLDLSTLDGVLSGLSPAIVDLTLPRFELEAEFELSAELRALGMNAPFDDITSFDAIVEGLGVIMAIMHKTVIKVDEKGAEAAAATAIVVGESGAPEPTATMVVDRPFVLAIQDQPTDTLLFLGRVLDPNG